MQQHDVYLPHGLSALEDPGGASRSGLRTGLALPLLRWANSLEAPNRPTLLTIPGGSASERNYLLRAYLDPRFADARTDAIEDVEGEQTESWWGTGVIENLYERVARMQLPPEVRRGFRVPVVDQWELMWAVMRVDPFVVEEPLRSVVEHSETVLADVHRALWEARFLDRENADKTPVLAFMGAVQRWMRGADLSDEDAALLSEAGIHRRIERDEDKLDALCFFLSVAAQNGLMRRVVLAFNGLERALDGNPADERALRQLLLTFRVIDRWVRMGGCPIGLLVGAPVDTRSLNAFQLLSHPLARRIRDGLSWTF